MLFSYGDGTYIQGRLKISGRIILGDHRLYLRDEFGDLTRTYIPLEKIDRVRLRFNTVELNVHPSTLMQYKTFIKGKTVFLRALVKDIVARRGLKKKFLISEWFDAS